MLKSIGLGAVHAKEHRMFCGDQGGQGAVLLGTQDMEKITAPMHAKDLWCHHNCGAYKVMLSNCIPMLTHSLCGEPLTIVSNLTTYLRYYP